MNEESNPEQGTALVLTLLLLAIFTLLGAAYLQVSSTESSISRNEVNGALAFNLADAGLEHAVSALPGTDVDALLLSGTAMLANQSLGEGTYDVAITNNIAPAYPLGVIPADTGGATKDDDGYIVLTSTGQFKDAVRSVSVLAKRTAGGGTSSPFAQGIYGELKIQTSGGQIDGVGSSTCGIRTNGEIDPGSTVVFGDATAGGQIKNQAQISGTVTEYAPPITIPPVACPTGGYTPTASIPTGPGITYDGSSGILKLSGSANLTLPAGTYYFKEISASTLVQVNVTGPTEIFIDLKLDFKGASTLNPTGVPADLMVWGCGTNNISLAIKDGGVNHFGMYAPTGYFDSSSSSIMYGAVVAKEFKMSGNSSFFCDDSIIGTIGGGGGSGDYEVLPRSWTQLGL